MSFPKVALGILCCFSLLLSNCKKDSATIKSGLSSFSMSSWDDLEFYNPDDSLEISILEALWELDEEDESLGFVSLNKGIWLIETGINYAFGDQPYLSYNDFVEEESYQLDVFGEDLSLLDVKNVIIDLVANINSELSASKGFKALDVYVEDLTSSELSIGVKILYADGYSGIASSWDVESSIPGASTDRRAGLAQNCSSDPVTPAWTDCANRARSVLRSYTGQPSGSFQFYTNVRYLSSLSPAPSRLISAERLLGQPNAVVSAHQGNVHESLCLTMAEQDDYAEAMFDDVKDKLPKDWGVITIFTDADKDPFGNNTQWDYVSVVIGANNFYTGAPLLPETVFP